MHYPDRFHMPPEQSLFLAKKKWDENVYCGMRMESRNITFPQTKTILQGINIPSVQLDDIQAVLNMRDAWRFLLGSLKEPLTFAYWCKLNEYIARNEALEWGKLRTSSVGISGTDYLPPVPVEAQTRAEFEAIVTANTSATEKAPDAAAADAREQASQKEMRSRMGDLNIGRRPTYAEYVQDLIRGDEMNRSEDYTPPVSSYTFYDLDGNGTEELLIFSDDLITSVVGMKDGLTNEGKVYSMYLCDGNVLVDYDSQPNALGERWYHIFRFANDGDPVFSNPKEQSIVRLKQCKDGTWWRTSSTDHYAEFDTEISEEEAMEILNSYKPVELQTMPLTQFEEP